MLWLLDRLSARLAFVLASVGFVGLIQLPLCAHQAKAVPIGNPNPWERVVRGAYENNGRARVERMGERWVLTVIHGGIHTVYIDDTRLDLARYVGKDVSARYRYVDRIIPDPKCFQAPCSSLLERRVLLQQLKVVKPGRLSK